MKEFLLFVKHGYGHGLWFKYPYKNTISLAEVYKLIEERYRKSHYGSLVPYPLQFFVLDQEKKEVCGIDKDEKSPLISYYVNSGYQHIST